VIPRSRLPFAVVTIGFFLILLFLTPLFLLGPGYLASWLKQGWPVYLLLAAACLPVGQSFAFELRAGKLGKADDWRGVMALTAPHESQGRPSRWNDRHCGLYLCAACIEGDFAALDDIEARFRNFDPTWLDRFALWFTLSRELRNRPGEAADFLAGRKAVGPKSARMLLSLHRAFSLVLARRSEEAIPLLRPLAISGHRIMAPLAAYLLAGCAVLYPPQANPAGQDSGRAAKPVSPRIARGSDSAERWLRRFGRAADEPGYAVLWGLARETARWLAEPGSDSAQYRPDSGGSRVTT